jgi:putative transposase
VSTAGYYQWRHRQPGTPALWQVAAQAAFTRHARSYGTRRLRAELYAEGHSMGRYALLTWLRQHGLLALSARPHRSHTTVADPAAVGAENRLLGQPAPTAPN